MEEKPNNFGNSSEIKGLKEEKVKIETDKNLDSIKGLLSNISETAIVVNRLDYFANSIPIGAFCNAIVFVLFGFSLCGVFSANTIELKGLLLIFGGIGQITVGIFEYLKYRSYPALLYFTYGFYCLSLFIVNNDSKEDEGYGALAFFYGACFLIFVPIFLTSLRVNVLFLAQTGFALLFFLLSWIGEIKHKKKVRGTTAGIFMSISGFISLYICISQLINETKKKEFIPSIPLSEYNEIDIEQKQDMTTTPQ